MTEEQRDSLLIEIFENVKNINNEHSKILEEHSKILEEHSKILNEHSKELVNLRQNMARMEHNLTDKIMALFDLYEVNKDKFEETDLRINGIENTLDWHDRRIMKLEMSD